MKLGNSDAGAKLLFYLLNLLFFLFFFSYVLVASKLPNQSGFLGVTGGGEVVLLNHFAEPPQLF